VVDALYFLLEFLQFWFVELTVFFCCVLFCLWCGMELLDDQARGLFGFGSS